MITNTPFVIGITGGTGAGKTTLTSLLAEELGSNLVTIVDADSYYRDLRHIPLNERHHTNFDHPDALDTKLLLQHIEQLKNNHPITKNLYDFACHTRIDDTITLTPKPFIIVEGILIFSVKQLLPLYDLKIFLDEESDIRLLRRVQRDTRDRGRSVDLIVMQYQHHIRPMHTRFVEPAKQKADIIISPGTETNRAVQQIFEHLKTIGRLGQSMTAGSHPAPTPS
ncbi:MAG: uridine kinase [Deltaproteobacteria bacterium]|nr:uridine kinase [Deltaproteobacteria bacterium]